MPFCDDDLKAVLVAETNELKALAKLIGLDPGQDFRGLCLSGADLSGQDLVGFDFSNADLSNANFTGANLTGTLFDHASLCEANFSAANLRDALFLYGDCTGSNFCQAHLDNTFFIGCDLVDIKGELRPVLLMSSCPPPIYPAAAVEALAEALQDPNRVVRGLAAVALGRMDSPEAARSALPILIDEIRSGSDDMVSDSASKIADEFEASVAAVLEIMSRSASQVQLSARSLTEKAKLTGDGAVNLAVSTDQAIINVQTVSAAAEQLLTSIAEIALKAEPSSRASQETSEEARYTNEMVERLAKMATHIDDVAKLINDIDHQTNLLALNATIETARVGDDGRGFAVVVNEVKSLAIQTACPTDEIVDQIQSIQNITKEMVATITGISTAIGGISDINSSISAALAEQSAASREIARNIYQAAEGTNELMANIAEVARVSVESGIVVNQMLDSAHSLMRETSGFMDTVFGLLKDIRQG